MDVIPALHPTDQELGSYGLGTLDDRSAGAVNEHLEHCPDCRKRVAEIPADGFLVRLRDAQAAGEPPSGPSWTGDGPGDRRGYQGIPPADTLPRGLAEGPLRKQGPFPMTQPPRSDPKNPPAERAATVLETDEDFRQALIASVKGQQPAAPVEPRAAKPPAETAGRPASTFRPTVRPPVPILTVFDDGKIDGEVIRIREPRFVIGRTEGDLRFPLDGRMSSRHAEITHQVVGGVHRWVVTDLQSTHGMFVRVSRTVLADKAEFLVGNGRYRFDANEPERDATVDYAANEPVAGETLGWSEGTTPFRPPALTELLGREIGNRVLLVKGEYWVGSDPSCAACRPDDPFCEARHVRLFRNMQGQWHAEHNKTQNGLWLRMAQITADAMILFQVGEQRFKLKVN